jgi:hypothetical protein
VRRLSLLLVVICAGAAGIALLAPGTQASRSRITMSPAVARLAHRLFDHAPPAVAPQSLVVPAPGRQAQILRAPRGHAPSVQAPISGYSCPVASGSCSLKPCIKFAGAAPAVQTLGGTQVVGRRAVTIAPSGNSGCKSAPATVPASLPATVPQARPIGLLPAS